MQPTHLVIHEYSNQVPAAPQVVFEDVADIMGHDPVPHVCRFRISPLLRAEPGDMVAIYRVPNVAPHEYTNYVDVDHTEAEDNDKGRRVVFDPVNLPSEEDFYQFQYVRGGNQGCDLIDTASTLVQGMIVHICVHVLSKVLSLYFYTNIQGGSSACRQAFVDIEMRLAF